MRSDAHVSWPPPYGVLFGLVCDLLRQRWSPQQIAGILKRTWPNDMQHTVSHETIYNVIYAQPKDELRKVSISIEN